MDAYKPPNSPSPVVDSPVRGIDFFLLRLVTAVYFSLSLILASWPSSQAAFPDAGIPLSLFNALFRPSGRFFPTPVVIILFLTFAVTKRWFRYLAIVLIAVTIVSAVGRFFAGIPYNATSVLLLATAGFYFWFVLRSPIAQRVHQKRGGNGV
jgi:hypothetical protein